MSYLVLARKWRPQSFETLVGQDHVVRALSHALSSQRLHHAWLFTGTRGVGKTTLARILAKSLNCETGITANPCGKCLACTEIDTGRFVDYIELDAASNRGIDEMTQLLEQAVYAPSVGRFKVYVIDEVHMLTGPAFNAMLKTLEEPPAHVKFVLATTDPQKIPATILSRCLQFNLKQMTPESIISHLEFVLDKESILFETGALRLIARAASGSMRDALSLTDQAIAFSAGNLTTESIQSMLGTVDQSYLIGLLQAIVIKNATEVIKIADNLSQRGLSFAQALADMSVLLSNIAIEQRIPDAISNTEPLFEQIKELAQITHADTIQLFYSIAVHSRNELSLSPDEYAGFVMACLRMMSLAPDVELKAELKIEDKTKTDTKIEINAETTVSTKTETSAKTGISVKAETSVKAGISTETETNTDTAIKVITNRINITDVNSQTWPELVKMLPLSGAADELARQSEWIAYSNQEVNLRMGVDVLGQTSAKDKLQDVLSEYFGFKIKLNLEYAATGKDTAFAVDEANKQKVLLQAKQDANDDPFVQTLIEQFQGQVLEESIRPAD